MREGLLNREPHTPLMLLSSHRFVSGLHDLRGQVLRPPGAEAHPVVRILSIPLLSRVSSSLTLIGVVFAFVALFHHDDHFSPGVSCFQMANSLSSLA